MTGAITTRADADRVAEQVRADHPHGQPTGPARVATALSYPCARVMS